MVSVPFNSVSFFAEILETQLNIWLNTNTIYSLQYMYEHSMKANTILYGKQRIVSTIYSLVYTN